MERRLWMVVPGALRDRSGRRGIPGASAPRANACSGHCPPCGTLTYPRAPAPSTALRPSPGGTILGSTYLLDAQGSCSVMGFWRRLFGGDQTRNLKPQRLDYLNEALALERQGDYESALTSYRLALRDNANDPRILQNMAIAFTKTVQVDEAIRHYRRALALDDTLVGAHYGLAFRLKEKGDAGEAMEHLRKFLARPPKGPDADRWVRHAEATL